MQINKGRSAEFGAGAGYTMTEVARRAQIIDATIETVAELGYHKASFARIVERAGLSSTRMVSYYFPSKADLMFAVVGAILDAKQEAAGYDGVSDRAGLLRAYIETEIGFLRAHPRQVRALLEIGRVWASEGTTLNGMVWRDVQLGRLERQLRQGQREGVFGEFDVSVMATTIRQALDGAVFRLAEDPELDLAAYGRELAGLFDRATRA